MALNRSLNHVSYHDSGLQGISGAMTVLRALSHNPYASRITLSHNALGDAGVVTLASGILELRKTGRLVMPLLELNLTSSGITDKGLDALIKYLLLPSPPPQSQPPTLHELILSNNNISLSGATPHLLSTALSHPASSLKSLTLSTNTRIAADPASMRAFLQHLEPTSLIQLQLNACGLQPEGAKTIARWLAEPTKGGRLGHLELNANSLGVDRFGTNRLAKIVYSGLNVSLQRLELAVNDIQVANLDDDDDETPQIAQLSINAPGTERRQSPNGREAEQNDVLQGDDLPFPQIKPLLSDALARNQVLQLATRYAALSLLSPARILLHAKRPSISAEEASEQVQSGDEGSQAMASMQIQGARPIVNYSYKATHDRSDSSAILKLPPELILHILRCFSALEPVPLPPNPSLASSFNPGQPHPPVFASPLNNTQFARIVSLAQDKSTLKGMTHRFEFRSGAVLKRDSRDQGRVSLHNAHSFLGVVGCLEYERKAL